MQLILVKIKWHIKWKYLIQKFHDICPSYYFKFIQHSIFSWNIYWFGYKQKNYAEKDTVKPVPMQSLLLSIYQNIIFFFSCYGKFELNLFKGVTYRKTPFFVPNVTSWYRFDCNTSKLLSLNQEGYHSVLNILFK